MTLSKSFNYSYWESKHFFCAYDLIVIGSGIVGLSAAISFKQKNPKARVLVLERDFLFDGASSKNAGFACFGSAGELLADLSNNNKDVVWQTVEMRWQGLQLLRKRLGDKQLGYESLGGFELFQKKDAFERATQQLQFLNKELKSTLKLKDCYTVDKTRNGLFGNTVGVIRNRYEGQLDTGLMMIKMLHLARKKNIVVLNGVTVTKLQEINKRVELFTNHGSFMASKTIVATNGFAKQLLKLKDVKPARAQVLVTRPIKNLAIRGAFHFEEGYYYFRNIDNRILLGGGRNLDVEGETTFEQGIHKDIQAKLDEVLATVVLPRTPYQIEQRWSGIMGVGSEKKPIIQPAGHNVLAAVRMGGMGVAIGSWVGEKAAEMLE